MRKLLFLLSLSGLTLAGCNPNEEEPSTTPKTPVGGSTVPPSGTPKLDTDGDGSISFEEFSQGPMGKNAPSREAVRERFDRIDSDKDGSLSQEELRVAMEKMQNAASGGGAPGQNPASEGSSSSNAAGTTSPDGNPASRLDADGDSFVSMEEFVAGPGGQGGADEAKKRFESVDADKDGKLSSDEIRNFFQNRSKGGAPNDGNRGTPGS